MLQHEFESRVGIEVSAKDYAATSIDEVIEYINNAIEA